MKSLTCIIAHPDEMARAALRERAEAAGLAVRDVVRDARSLPERLNSVQPHAVFLHALTPGFDRAGLEEAIARLPLARRPALIYLVPDSLPMRQAAELSPALPVHPSGEEMRAAVEKARPLPVDEALFARAEKMIARMGLPAHPARAYLALAVGMAYNDIGDLTPLSQVILPALARRYDIPPRRAADAMRRLIDRAWTTGDIEAQYAFFGNTIEETRGKPTLTAFIATAAEYLRLGEDAKPLT